MWNNAFYSDLLELCRQEALDIRAKYAELYRIFPEILKEVERRYDVKFHIQSKQMEEEIFSGSISTKLSVEEILDYIDVDNKYSRSRKGNVIVLTDR